jgi:hypothetical protein
MKKYNLLFLAIVLVASCSAPKYTYHFDHFDYSSKKKPVVQNPDHPVAVTSETTVAIEEKTMVASVKENEVLAPAAAKEEVVAKLKSMSKEERKELKKEVKRFVKENKKEIKEGNGQKQLENDVKLAAIFGAVGIVLLIIGGDVLYVLGAVALLIGLYFLIRWLSRQ